MTDAGEVRLIAADALDLRLAGETWDFAARHEEEIFAHWARRSAENPHYFNGVVLLLADYALTGDRRFCGRFLVTDFRSFLYWRETGKRSRAVRDTVGTALIRSREGHVLLCQQRPGHLNTGFTTPPGGFIDGRDVNRDGTVDVVRAVEREIAEETGLGPECLRRESGFLIAVAGPLISIAVPWQSDLAADDLLARAGRHIAAETDGELARVLALPAAEARDTLSLPDYARVLLGAPWFSKTSA